jgi:hypothetical protein
MASEPASASAGAAVSSQPAARSAGAGGAATTGPRDSARGLAFPTAAADVVDSFGPRFALHVALAGDAGPSAAVGHGGSGGGGVGAPVAEGDAVSPGALRHPPAICFDGEPGKLCKCVATVRRDDERVEASRFSSATCLAAFDPWRTRRTTPSSSCHCMRDLCSSLVDSPVLRCDRFSSSLLLLPAVVELDSLGRSLSSV